MGFNMNTVIKDTLRNIQLVETNRRFSIEGKDSKVYDYTDAILAATSFLPNSTTIRERVKLLLDDYDLLYDKNLSIIELMEKIDGLDFYILKSLKNTFDGKMPLKGFIVSITMNIIAMFRRKRL